MSTFEVVPDSVLAPWAGRVRAALVLGSGFGGIAKRVEYAVEFAYEDLPSFPRPAAPVAGHQGRLFLGTIGGVPVVVFAGRVHCYQGVTALDAAYPVRLAAALGADTLIVTNAAGGVSEELRVGDIVLIEDHINLSGGNPLVGWPGPEGGTPFVSVSDAYDQGLRALALAVCAEQGTMLHPGVYTGLMGPSYETPAEVEMLRRLGTDVVGMSTVPEVIAARALGLRVLGLSLVTNAAASHDLSHADVLDAGRRAEEATMHLLTALLERM
jgi:purine-nucleoside phosphorylase